MELGGTEKRKTPVLRHEDVFGSVKGGLGATPVAGVDEDAHPVSDSL